MAAGRREITREQKVSGKFIVKNSVEENMVKIQRQKQDLVEKAFGSSNAKRETSRINDIKALMEL